MKWHIGFHELFLFLWRIWKTILLIYQITYNLQNEKVSPRLPQDPVPHPPRDPADVKEVTVDETMNQALSQEDMATPPGTPRASPSQMEANETSDEDQLQVC